MEVNFVIDDLYLITHLLSSMSRDKFSSSRHKKDIVAFQNFAWSVSNDCYNLLTGRYYPTRNTKLNINNLHELPKFLNTLRKSRKYKILRTQTVAYLHFCKKQWIENYPATSKFIKEKTGFNLKGKFNVFITHSSLKNGTSYNNTIFWGHKEEFANYCTIYIWHEILHSYLTGKENTKLNHAIIQLLTDNELRIFLNGGSYPPFNGHSELFPIMKKILPRWKRYISKGGNIIKFRNGLTKWNSTN